MKCISKKRIIVSVLMVAFLFGLFVPRYEVSAASKKARYWAQLFGPDYKGDAQNIKTIKFKKNKLVIKASLKKGNNVKVYSSPDDVNLKMKKRTFKISKKCKFYAGGAEDGINRISRKEFKSYTKKYMGSGLALIIYTNQKGQIYKMVMKC